MAMGPRKLDDKQTRRVLQKRNLTNYLLQIWLFRRKSYGKEIAKKKFFPMSQVSQIQKEHKMSHYEAKLCILCIVSAFRNKDAPFVLLLFFTFL